MHKRTGCLLIALPSLIISAFGFGYSIVGPSLYPSTAPSLIRKNSRINRPKADLNQIMPELPNSEPAPAAGILLLPDKGILLPQGNKRNLLRYDLT